MYVEAGNMAPQAGCPLGDPAMPALPARLPIFLLTLSIFIFIIPLNTGKEVIRKYMNFYHSEVAAA
jgi:hypothetical protein